MTKAVFVAKQIQDGDIVLGSLNSGHRVAGAHFAFIEYPKIDPRPFRLAKFQAKTRVCHARGKRIAGDSGCRCLEDNFTDQQAIANVHIGRQPTNGQVFAEKAREELLSILVREPAQRSAQMQLAAVEFLLNKLHDLLGIKAIMQNQCGAHHDSTAGEIERPLPHVVPKAIGRKRVEPQ